MGAETEMWPTPAAAGFAVRIDPTTELPPGREVARVPAIDLRGANRTMDPGVEPAPIRAILFDVEDVLYDASEWNRWLAQIFARHQPRGLEAEFARRWQIQFLPTVYRGQREFFAAFTECLGAIGLAAGHVEEVVAAALAQIRHEEDTRRPLPGVRATLHGLRSAGVSLGVLTNLDRTAEQLSGELARLRLDGLFDCLITALDLHRCLPDAYCFDQALVALGCPAEQALFVGHDACELRGGRDHGLSVAAFNARTNLPGIPTLERFEELMHFVVPVAAAPSAG